MTMTITVMLVCMPLQINKNNKQVCQFTRLAYIPTCQSPLPPRLWPWPLTSQGHPKWSLWVKHRNCCRSWHISHQKSMTLIFDPSRSSKVKGDGANWKPVGRTCKCSGGPTSYLSPFSRYFESNFYFSPFDLGRANPWAKGHQNGRRPTIHLGLPFHKTPARSRKLSTRYVLPNLFTFWPLGG